MVLRSYLLLGFLTLLLILPCCYPYYTLPSSSLSLFSRKRSQIDGSPFTSRDSVIQVRVPVKIYNSRSTIEGIQDSTKELQQNPLKAVYSIMLFTFVTYAFTLAPDSSPKDFELIQKLIATPFHGTSNAIFVFLFNALGVIPATLAALLLPGAKNQKVPAIPFVFSSFFLGFFAIGPYLALRQWNLDIIEEEKGFGSRLFDNKATLSVLLGFSLYLFYFLFQQLQLLGIDHVVNEFWQLFMTRQLVNVSSLDFTVLSLAMYDPIREDIARRYTSVGKQSPLPAWAYCAIPVLGPVVYLLIRPPLRKER